MIGPTETLAQNLQDFKGEINNYYTLWTLHGWSYCRVLL